MSKKITIHPAAIRDQKAIIKLLFRVGLQRLLTGPNAMQPDKCLVARNINTVVGLTAWRSIHRQACHSLATVVRQDHQRSGIARALVIEKYRRLYDMGVRHVTVSTDNPVVIDWLKRKFAYRVVGRRKKHGEIGRPRVQHWTDMAVDLESIREVIHG
ncbi:MAG: GNAT family N-acetyltransferase [Thermodesulfobacteriota bacterium]|nr:GNAT family N-acetyltransferase [Thermodesulfobacteriota bacterium]